MKAGGSPMKEITFHEHKITATARQTAFRYWDAGYKVAKDGQIVRIKFNVVWRETAAAAEDAALVLGLQYVDDCLAVRQITATVSGEG
jgi:hypothetical protein